MLKDPVKLLKRKIIWQILLRNWLNYSEVFFSQKFCILLWVYHDQFLIALLSKSNGGYVRISELGLPFSSHPNISDGNFILVHQSGSTKMLNNISVNVKSVSFRWCVSFKMKYWILTTSIGVAWSWYCLCARTDWSASTILGCVAISWSVLDLGEKWYDNFVLQTPYSSAACFGTISPRAPRCPICVKSYRNTKLYLLYILYIIYIMNKII